MIEAAADIVGKVWVAHSLCPIEQEVIVIEDILSLLRLHIGREKFAQLGRPGGAPREGNAQHLLDRELRVHAARVDRKARAFHRKTAFGLRQTKLMPDQVHQIGRILAIMDRERRIEPNLAGVVTQEPRADPVERPGPGQCIGHDTGAIPHYLANDPLDAPRHLGGGTP